MSEETNPIEQLGTVDSYQEAMEAFLKELSENIDPADFMPPTQREIAKLSLEELTAEYELVQQKTSTRSAAQRKYITQRFEHEQNKEDANEE
jgi:hypothetical protein